MTQGVGPVKYTFKQAIDLIFILFVLALCWLLEIILFIPTLIVVKIKDMFRNIWLHIKQNKKGHGTVSLTDVIGVILFIALIMSSPFILFLILGALTHYFGYLKKYSLTALTLTGGFGLLTLLFIADYIAKTMGY